MTSCILVLYIVGFCVRPIPADARAGSASTDLPAEAGSHASNWGGRHTYDSGRYSAHDSGRCYADERDGAPARDVRLQAEARDPNALYAHREELANARAAEKIWLEQLTRNPKDFEAG